MKWPREIDVEQGNPHPPFSHISGRTQYNSADWQRPSKMLSHYREDPCPLADNNLERDRVGNRELNGHDDFLIDRGTPREYFISFTPRPPNGHGAF
jgi:hypothetical protein